MNANTYSRINYKKLGQVFGQSESSIGDASKETFSSYKDLFTPEGVELIEKKLKEGKSVAVVIEKKKIRAAVYVVKGIAEFNVFPDAIQMNDYLMNLNEFEITN